MTIDEPGQYHLQTLGLGKYFTYRLEDEGEWPLTVPGGGGVVLQRFEPGFTTTTPCHCRSNLHELPL